MNNVLNLVENQQTSEFYPTPKSLVDKMIAGVKWDYIHSILEPSAGKGDILREIAKKEARYERGAFDVDCVELDQNLRQILKYNFSEERADLLRDKEESLKPQTMWNSKTSRYDKIPSPNPTEYEHVKTERNCFFSKGIHIVHDDFLTYEPFKRYDLIIMNPPFSNGDKHLLKAIKLQENGGKIICLLNAETIRNPYTTARQKLSEQLEKYDADIEYIENAFVDGERKTGVEVALVRIDIPAVQEESEIYNRMREAEEYEDYNFESTELEVTDIIKASVARYRIEVKAGIELIRQYRALKPYMIRSFDTKEVENEDGTKETKYADDTPILRLINSSDRSYDSSVTINEYVEAVRLKYWRAFLSNKKFVGKLTSKLQDEYRERVCSYAKYEFSEFNIYTLIAEMNAQIKTGIEDEIIAMYERLTQTHSYYPEFSQNRHYYDGWKTNQAYKIGKKVILPCHGVFSEWSSRLDSYSARKTLEDIERILNFFDGHMSEEVNSWSMLQNHLEHYNNTKKIPLKFFSVTFYKKGTVHITFTCPELIERFNIYAAQQKSWLPPGYGKKAYKDMTQEEKAVIDSFQGEKAYAEIMAKSDYYLAPVTNNQMLMLEG